jgi:Fe-S-cluster containining protein
VGKSHYDCLKCIGYCCAIYDRVEVSKKDIARLAKHFGTTPDKARRKFTKQYSKKERILKRTPDPIFGESCMFQDPETRLCSIYEARPQTCRDWPTHGQKDHCVYYDMLQFERQQQGNEEAAPFVEVRFLEGGAAD